MMPNDPESNESSTFKVEGDERSVKNTFQGSKTLFSWIAPARPFKRINREFYVTLIAMAAIVGLVLFLVEGFMPVILIVSLIFLFYIMNTVPPEVIDYSITDEGIKVAGRLTKWENLTRYWFSKRFDNELVIFESKQIPGRVEFVVNSPDKEEIRKVVKDYLPEEEASPSVLDKAANWFGTKIPGANQL